MIPAKVTKEEALEVAQQDAARAYGDLSLYRVDVRLESDGWNIEYWFKDPNVNGGGPHYLIDEQTGGFCPRRITNNEGCNGCS
jgi:hypothetical protein